MNDLLSIPEELFLLTVNEKTGRKAFLKSKKFDLLLSASLLMDLALRNRIDTDLNNIIPDRPEPTGNPLLDTVLDLIQHSGEQQKITWWLLKLTEKSARYRELLVTGMVEKGLLKMEKERVFLGFSSTKYPILIKDQEVTEVKTRLKNLIFSDELPDFRDVVIISLAWYGGLLNLILPGEEIEGNLGRIEQLARMDLIGQAVSASMHELSRSILRSVITKDILGIKSPEEKLEELVEELKALMHIENDADLPDWLKKGTGQYLQTLNYIKETGTNEIVFNAKTGKYGLKAGASQKLSF